MFDAGPLFLAVLMISAIMEGFKKKYLKKKNSENGRIWIDSNVLEV